VSIEKLSSYEGVIVKKLFTSSNRRFVKAWLREAMLSRGGVLLVFDFDGTLAPIVNDRNRAFMRARTLKNLQKLSREFSCAVISGRALKDLRPRVKGLRLTKIVGNHGAEGLPELSRRVRGKRAELREWEKKLRAELRRVPDVDFENKGFSLALHYRNALRPRQTRAFIEEALRKCGLRAKGAKIIEGKAVFDVMPAGLPDKGLALLELLEITRARRAIYVGDDTTDEDVFRLPLGLRAKSKTQLLKIRVARKRASRADYFVKSQRDVDALLEMLLQVSRHRIDVPSTRAKRVKV
jgi:trehalose 6-phosphate phosphatase